ncbi:putative reverse transcriptase domain-containing protein [Tanacetum coccineum]
MPPKRRTTRATPATTTAPTTTVTDAQLQVLIDRGVAAALVERDASRSRDGDNSHGSGTGGRRQVPTQRECTYTDFLKCQPMNFKGTEGVVGLTQWVEKMESVFLISNYAITIQVKYASCTLQGSALMWWNSHIRAVGQDVAYAMPWTALKRMIKKIKYCLGARSKSCELWNHLKWKGWAMCQKCTNCKKIGHSARDCKGRPAATNNNNNNNQRAQGENPRGITALSVDVMVPSGCGCPNAEDEIMEIGARIGCCSKRFVLLGSAGTNPNSNVVTGTFLLNNRYASILFDNGADRSFVSTAFSSLIDIIPTTLDHGYDVELADGRII